MHLFIIEWKKWDLTFKQFSLPIQLKKNTSNAAAYLEKNQGVHAVLMCI